ncbi:MAG: hypothetical protein NW218_06490 [Saprospiraceae bacterium]|nr:hypothetical protein [Saprospiraceae bacterium]
MLFSFPVLFFTLLYYGFIAGIVYFFISRRRLVRKIRQDRFRGLAKRMQLEFLEEDRFGLKSQLNQFDLFRREHRCFFYNNTRITNVLYKKVGETDVYLFDYTYLKSYGKTVKRITQTVFFANNRHWDLPNFKLKPETWWHKVKQTLGFDHDINFPDGPEFSDKVWLKGQFEELVRNKFSPELRKFILEHPPAHVEGNNFYLISYKPGQKLEADEAEKFFDNQIELMQLMEHEGKLELLSLAELKEKSADPISLEKDLNEI